MQRFDFIKKNINNILSLQKNELVTDRVWQTAFFTIFVIIVAMIRLRFCLSLPIQTGDITRHLYYGLLVNHFGLESAGYPLTHFGEAYKDVAWSFLPYSYPVVTLFFFSMITKVYSSIFIVKVILTLIEGANAFLIYFYTKEKWLGVIYWASPLSIWWVSGEAQFEPLQSFFLLLALCLKSKNNFLAFIFLAIAIQVKVSAVLLLPFFLVDAWISNPRRIFGSLQAFLVGFAPTFIAGLYYPSVMQVLLYSSPLDYNPYIWNFSSEKTQWNLPWMVVANGTFSYAGIFLIIYFALKQEQLKIIIKHQQLRFTGKVSLLTASRYIAPFLFILFCKTFKNVQFWYFSLFLSFILPIKSRFQRYCFFILHPLLDLYGAIQVFSGPLYVNISGYYKGISVFQKLEIFN